MENRFLFSSTALWRISSSYILKSAIGYFSVCLSQLVLTVMLLTIIVYIYTVIAFNFFRKFYVQEEDDEVDKKCHDMLTVPTYIFRVF